MCLPGDSDDVSRLEDVGVAQSLHDLPDTARVEPVGQDARPAGTTGTTGTTLATTAMRDHTQNWHDAVGLAAIALQDRPDAVAEKELGEQGNLSIIVIPDTSTDTDDGVHYAHWMNPATLYGQLVREVAGEVVFSMIVGRYAQPLRSPAHAEVLHPAIGVKHEEDEQG